MNRKADARLEENYEVFINKDFFKRGYYIGQVELVTEGQHRHFDYQIITISETERALSFVENTVGFEIGAIEKEKIDIIQEEYLFSMVIDLKKDTCKNSVVTEVRADGPTFPEVPYSQWRYMISNMFLPDDKGIFLNLSDPDYIINHLEQERSYWYEIQMKNMQGEYIWVRLTFARMRGFSRENPVLVYTVQDINENMLHLLQQENIIAAVEEKNEQLTNINTAKNVFISNMSHEIRTPINAVLGMDEMILREAKDKKILGYAQNIKNAGQMLLSIINDILDFSKIEAGKMEIIPVEYELPSVIKDVCSMVSIKIKEKGLSFKLRVDQALPAMLRGDDLRIRQILTNLLTNAVKYTPSGSISMEVNTVCKDEQTVAVRFEVKDTGIGMRPEEMSKLFVEFERLDEQRNHYIEGAGLGLTIVLKLLEQMGSKLEVESEYQKGSLFAFTLTQEIVDSESIRDASKHKRQMEHEGALEVHAPNAKILVVDDNMVNLEVVRGLLERTKVQITTAKNGQECLEKLVAEKFDLVFLDHLMPVMDGIEAVNRIRNMGEGYKELPVIALTANVMSDAMNRYKNAGFTDFLEKPVPVDKLEMMLRQYLPDELLI